MPSMTTLNSAWFSLGIIAVAVKASDSATRARPSIIERSSSGRNPQNFAAMRMPSIELTSPSVMRVRAVMFFMMVLPDQSRHKRAVGDSDVSCYVLIDMPKVVFFGRLSCPSTMSASESPSLSGAAKQPEPCQASVFAAQTCANLPWPAATNKFRQIANGETGPRTGNAFHCMNATFEKQRKQIRQECTPVWQSERVNSHSAPGAAAVLPLHGRPRAASTTFGPFWIL